MKKESKHNQVLSKSEMLTAADELIKKTAAAKGLSYAAAVEFLGREDPEFLAAVMRISKSKK